MRTSFQDMIPFLLDLGDTQSSIARQTGVNPSTIHRISKGIFRPKDKLAEKIIEMYCKRVKRLKDIGADKVLGGASHDSF